jgi:hypothetical protein
MWVSIPTWGPNEEWYLSDSEYCQRQGVRWQCRCCRFDSCRWSKGKQMTKVCSKCHMRKGVSRFRESEFHVNNARPDGFQSQCKECMKKIRKTYTSDQRRGQNLQHRYGLSEADFAALLQKYAGCCAICGHKGTLVVDHCHSSGSVRGLLCHGCNRGLGCFADDLNRLQRAIVYLKGE